MQKKRLRYLLTYKSRVVEASLDTLFLIGQLNIIAELVHHFQKGLIDKLLPPTSNPVHIGKGHTDLPGELFMWKSPSQ